MRNQLTLNYCIINPAFLPAMGLVSDTQKSWTVSFIRETKDYIPDDQ